MTRGEDITTRFKVDISDLKKGITEATNQIKKANSEFNKASAGLDNWKTSSEGITAKLQQLKSVLEQYNAKLKIYQQQLDLAQKSEKEATEEITRLRQALEKAKIEYGSNSEQVKKLQKELTEAEKAEMQMKKQVTDLTVTLNNQEATITKTNKEISSLEKSLVEVEKAEKTANQTGKDVSEVLDEMHDKANKASDGFTVMKGALASLVADGIRKAIDASKNFVKETINVGKAFDSSMSQVSAVSGATGEELEALRKKAKEMGANTKFSASEVAEAFNYMAMAGWKTEDMLSGIEGVLNLAAASGEDLATTSDIVTDALTAMGYSAKDAGKLADVMASASSNANTNVSMMGETFKYAASVSGALGYSMEDTAIAIGLMANSGIKASQAGTSLRSIMQRLATDTSDCRTELKKFGVEVINTDGSMKPLKNIMDDMREAFSKLSEEQQINLAKTVAGTEAMSGLLAIVNAAPDDYEKLTKAVNESTGAAKKMADTMQDDLNGDLTSFGSTVESIQISIYEKLKPSLREGTQDLKKWANSVDWDRVGQKVAKSFEKILSGFKWLLANSNKVTTLVKLMINAFAIKKINDFGNRVIKLGKDFKSASGEIKLTTNLVKGMRLTQQASTVATNAATIAQKGFNAALKANPIGAAVIGLELLVGGYKLVSGWIKDANKNTNEYYLATEKLTQKQDDLTKTINENAQARKESITSAENEGGAIDVLFNRLTELEKVENKTNTQKYLMKQIVSELNELVPELSLKYDEETDSLNQSVDAIKSKITAQKELIKAEAAQSHLSEIAKEQVELEKTQLELVENQKKVQEELTQAEKEYAEAKEKWEKADPWNKRKEYDNMLKAEKKVNDLQDAVDKNTASLHENKKSLAKLNQEYSYFEEYSMNSFNTAEIEKRLSSFVQKCSDAGKKIPQSIADGMKEGNYAIPESIEGLEKLIQFDNALSTANMTGKKIPAYISQGVIDGKISVEQAMEQVNQVTTLADKAQEMYKSGKAIPENLSVGILEGSVSVENANKILEASVTYDELVKKAEGAGLTIPLNLANNIRNGSVTVQSANEALQTMIDFNDSLEKAGLAGKDISSNLANSIIEGRVKVEDAKTIMNNWIEFNKANEEAIKSGIEIPKYLRDGILSGQLDVQTANSQMNKWVEFNTAKAAAEEAGVTVSDELSKNISEGKVSVESATNALNQAIGQQLKDTKQTGIDAGGNLVDGFILGIKNPSKQREAYSAIGAFGSSILAKFKTALDEHSPSKASNKMGQFLVEGLKIGVKKQSESALKQISNFGRSILDNLNGELEKSTTFQDLTQNVKKSVANIKTSVGSLKVSNPDMGLYGTGNSTTNNNVNNNYTQIINAPKQPSRLEIYRQSRNLLSLKGGG